MNLVAETVYSALSAFRIKRFYIPSKVPSYNATEAWNSLQGTAESQTAEII